MYNISCNKFIIKTNIVNEINYHYYYLIMRVTRGKRAISP